MKLIIDIPETVNPDEWERIITEVAAEVATDERNGTFATSGWSVMRDAKGRVEAEYEYEEV